MIDLDLAPAAPGRPPIALARRLRGSRPAWTVGVLLVALLMLTASARPAPRLTLVLSAAGQLGAAFLLENGTLFTASPSGESVIRRWDLAAGEPGWTATVPRNVQVMVYDGTARILMATSPTDPRRFFLDAVTGALLREDLSGGEIVSMAGGRLLLETDLGTGQQRVRMVDERTGRETWQRTVDGGRYLGVDSHDEQVVPRLLTTVDDAGNAAVLRVADGVVLARADLGLDGVDAPMVTTGSGALYTAQVRQDGTMVAAWSLEDLKPRWQSTSAPVGFVSDCGPVLCLSAAGAIVALDRADGRALWQRDELSLAYSYDGRTLFAYDRAETPQSLVLDPATGRVLQRLGPTERIEQVMMRPDAQRLGRIWVEVNGADGSPRVIGQLNKIATTGCTVTGEYLACPTSRGPIDVWRIPTV